MLQISPNRPPTVPLRRPGFTLVELLVVMSILALLGGVLFPVLASAREKGRQMMCLSNLRQLGTAFLLYASDWDGLFPPPGGPHVRNGWVQSGGQGEGQDIGGIWLYVRQRGNAGQGNVFSCPQARPGTPQAWSPGQNYVMNDYLRMRHNGQDRFPGYLPFPAYATGINPDCMGASPTEVILLYEGAQYINGSVARNGSPFFSLGPSATPPLPVQAPQNYHQEGSNFLFCDGHVQRLRPDQTWPPERQPDVQRLNPDLATIYQGCGEDRWNPLLPGVIYP